MRAGVDVVRIASGTDSHLAVVAEQVDLAALRTEARATVMAEE